MNDEDLIKFDYIMSYLVDDNGLINMDDGEEEKFAVHWDMVNKMANLADGKLKKHYINCLSYSFYGWLIYLRLKYDNPEGNRFENSIDALISDLNKTKTNLYNTYDNLGIKEELIKKVCHPDNYNKSYLRLKVPRLEEVSVLLSKLKNNSS